MEDHTRHPQTLTLDNFLDLGVSQLLYANLFDQDRLVPLEVSLGNNREDDENFQILFFYHAQLQLHLFLVFGQLMVTPEGSGWKVCFWTSRRTEAKGRDEGGSWTVGTQTEQQVESP